MAKKADRYFIVDGQHVFVPADRPGLYWLTHPSILVTDCDFCEAKKGERCLGANGKRWSTEVHHTRRTSGVSAVKKLIAGSGRIGKLKDRK